MRRVFLTLLLALLSAITSLLPRLFPPEKPQPRPREITESASWVPLSTDISPWSSGTPMILVVDSSGSMRGAEDRALEVLDAWSGPVGLVTFGDSARMLAEPGGKKATIRQTLSTLPYRGGSNLEEGLTTAISWFQHHDTGGELWVVSDGDANVGEVNPQTIYGLTAQLAARGIRLTVVERGVPSTTVLRDMAATSGGRIYAEGSDVR